MTKPTWKYISLESLASSGIYIDDDLRELRDHIMFLVERPAILNILVRGMMDQPTTMHGGESFANFLDETSVEKIAISAWKEFWNKVFNFWQYKRLIYKNIHGSQSNKTNIGHNCAWIRFTQCLRMVRVLNRSHLGLYDSAFITLKSRKTKNKHKQRTHTVSWKRRERRFKFMETLSPKSPLKRDIYLHICTKKIINLFCVSKKKNKKTFLSKQPRRSLSTLSFLAFISHWE